MEIKLTEGPITKSLLLFTFPMLLGNLLQQLYNIADSIIVGRYLGRAALAAVGSSFTLMTFITGILLGLAMGSGAYFSILFGRKDDKDLRNSIFQSFILSFLFSLVLNILVFLLLDSFITLLKVPEEVKPLMKDYLIIIFYGIFAIFITNYIASFLRSIGNSLAPLLALAFAAVLNIVLDLLFVITFNMGVKGAAIATVTAQYASALILILYAVSQYRSYMPKRSDCYFNKSNLKPLVNLSLMTSIQQSVMNFGILLVQGVVNSFGTAVMAAFASGVKIDAFAYMPLQDFGNAYSTFIAQNYGKRDSERIERGTKSAIIVILLFSALITLLIFAFAPNLIALFVSKNDTAVIEIGSEYLKIEGAFYFAIGFLFMLYGFYRAVEKPWMSIVLTVISLGTRVVLSYSVSPIFGEKAIWASIPIGWILADAVGFICLFAYRRKVRR